MMMKLKKLSLILLALASASVMVLSGCGTKDGDKAAEPTTVSAGAETDGSDALQPKDEAPEDEKSLDSGETEPGELSGTEASNQQAQEESTENSSGKPAGSTQSTESPGETEPVQPATKPEIQETTEAKADLCTLSISCSTVLNNMDKLKEEKKGIVPAGGIILSGCELEIREGDSVYDVLVRACQQNRVHMDADYTPVYGSAYIKGIANIYEGDCGNLSGWTYRVNGVFPGVGCSSYKVTSGDVIEFLYTCDMGADVGNIPGI